MQIAHSDPKATMYKTDAHALEAILNQINNPDNGSSINARWMVVLGDGPKDPKFGLRHAEVVRLLQSTVNQLRSLPPAAQARYETSIKQWWLAVIAPDHQWSGGNNSNPLIGQEHINLLGSLGDVMESRLDQTSAAPGGFNIDAVKDQCDEWIDSLAGSGLSLPMQALLTEGINHLKWLIEYVETFGLARVAREAEAVTGSLVLATPQVSDAARSSWNDRFKTWAGTLIVFTGLMTATHAAIESTGVVVQEIAPIVAEVVEVVDSDDEPDTAPP